MKTHHFHHLCLLAALCLASLATRAQSYDSYRLKDYALPDIKRNALDFTLGSDGGFSHKDKQDNTGWNVSADLGVLLDHWTYKQDFIGNHKLDFDFYGQLYDTEGSAKTRTTDFDITYDTRSQFYLSEPDKWFWMVGGDAQLIYNRDKAYNGTGYIFVFEALPKASIGWGRLEDVTDARQAVYILENLEERGAMARHLSDAEVHEFAQVISAIKNKRFFDSRRHTIEEISTVTRYLQERGYLSKEDVDYYTTLYDYWLYGGLHQRLSGFQTEVEVQPGYRREKTNLSSNNETDAYQLNARIGLQYEKPANLYWQHSAAASFGYQYAKMDWHDSFYDKTNMHTEHLNLSYYIGYYPNSRTHLRLGVEENLQVRKMKDEYKDWEKDTYTDTSLNLKAYYYLSPQLRLDLSANLNYQKDTDAYSGYRWYGGYAFTLTYALY